MSAAKNWGLNIPATSLTLQKIQDVFGRSQAYIFKAPTHSMPSQWGLHMSMIIYQGRGYPSSLPSIIVSFHDGVGSSMCLSLDIRSALYLHLTMLITAFSFIFNWANVIMHLFCEVLKCWYFQDMFVHTINHYQFHKPLMKFFLTLCINAVIDS